MSKFQVISKYSPKGDQEKAIKEISQSILKGNKFQTLLGVTGSGKTYVMAKIIEKIQKPTLIICHNKLLAAQIYHELKNFLPNNAVEYFISYYDYYQPESYIPEKDLYIEKDCSINWVIDRLRHSAVVSLLTRKDVVVVASVSAIYNLGKPEEYEKQALRFEVGKSYSYKEILKKLVYLGYQRNDYEFKPGIFKVKGDVIEIFPPSEEDKYIRLEFFDEELESIRELKYFERETVKNYKEYIVYPASFYAVEKPTLERALFTIEQELEKQIKYFLSQKKFLEANRIEKRTKADLELLKEFGYCKGIENYSRHFDGRKPGDPPYSLLEFFKKDFVVFIDESHVTLPQIKAMYRGDKSRKDNLVKHGFRLPCAYDNRPLKFEEFIEKAPQILFVSATPGKFELEKSSVISEMIVRPTGLLDPDITIKLLVDKENYKKLKEAKNKKDINTIKNILNTKLPLDFDLFDNLDFTTNLMQDVIFEISKVLKKNERVLITTLTKKQAEELSEYLKEQGFKAYYLHSNIDSVKRVEIIRDLRKGNLEVLVGVNLLREGLDIPEVSLVIILDADKQGFLRSETSLIQTIGRCARNVNGRAILYGDSVSLAMLTACRETLRRREIQKAYNEKHKIVPKSVYRPLDTSILEDAGLKPKDEEIKLTEEEILNKIEKLEKEMKKAAKNWDFEKAIKLREEIKKLRRLIGL